jgi:hypothetical protein
MRCGPRRGIAKAVEREIETHDRRTDALLPDASPLSLPLSQVRYSKHGHPTSVLK